MAEEGPVDNYEGRVHLGDCISFFIEGTKTEAQGAVVTIFRDGGGETHFEVNVMQRVPGGKGDIVNKSNQVYHYQDTDDLMWVREGDFLRTVPLEFIEGGGKSVKNTIYDLFPLQTRKLMLYYTHGPGGVPGLSMRTKLQWWHFDPQSLRGLEWKQRRCPAMNDEDLTSSLVCSLKPIIFDPFVSPLSYSHRFPQKHWNIRTWRMLLRDSVEPVPSLEFELDQLSRNTSCDMVFKEEIFLSGDCIRIIRALISQWVGANHSEMSPYDARAFMEHHERVVQKIVDWIAVRKEKEERDESSGSEESDLDEHMSFGGDSYSDDS